MRIRQVESATESQTIDWILPRSKRRRREEPALSPWGRKNLVKLRISGVRYRRNSLPKLLPRQTDAVKAGPGVAIFRTPRRSTSAVIHCAVASFQCEGTPFTGVSRDTEAGSTQVVIERVLSRVLRRNYARLGAAAGFQQSNRHTMKQPKRPGLVHGFTLLEIMIVVAIIGLLAAIAIPNLIRARTRSTATACINNLRQINDAKAQWALEAHQASTATPLDANLFGPGLYIKDKPVCPGGGQYDLRTVAETTLCDQPQHELN